MSTRAYFRERRRGHIACCRSNKDQRLKETFADHDTARLSRLPRLILPSLAITVRGEWNR
jgi:hypothetical protein